MRDDRHRRTRPAQRIDGQRDEAAELSLRHRAEQMQRLGRHLVGRFLLQGKVADLRAVAVHNHHAPAGVQHALDRGGHDRCVLRLLLVGAGLSGLGERIATQRHHRGLRHDCLLMLPLPDVGCDYPLHGRPAHSHRLRSAARYIL